jgi:hypothetical protein
MDRCEQKMKQKTTIKLDPEIIELLDYRAAESGISLTEYVLSLLASDSSTRCRACGLVRPKLWMVPDKVWRHYIHSPERESILCLPCWKTIVETIDGCVFQNRYGQPRIIDWVVNDRLREAEIARGHRRFPPARLTLIGLQHNDWRIVQSALKSASHDTKRLTDIADLIEYELQNSPRFPKERYS